MSLQSINTHNKESGAVFFYILLAIALLAALSFAVSHDRGNLSTMTDQQAKLAAQEIIDYGNTVTNAVQKLRLRGCKDTEISFENNVVNSTVIDYINPYAPADKSCHVYDIAGGGLNWQTPPSTLKLPVNSPTYWLGRYVVTGNTEWVGNGSTCGTSSCTDLIMFLNVPAGFCKTVNKQISLKESITQLGTFGGAPFKGNYYRAYTMGNTAESTHAKSKTIICLKSTHPLLEKYESISILLLAR